MRPIRCWKSLSPYFHFQYHLSHLVKTKFLIRRILRSSIAQTYTNLPQSCWENVKSGKMFIHIVFSTKKIENMSMHKENIISIFKKKCTYGHLDEYFRTFARRLRVKGSILHYFSRFCHFFWAVLSIKRWQIMNNENHSVPLISARDVARLGGFPPIIHLQIPKISI